MDYSPLEIMACVLARDLKDGEFGGIGAASEMPMAALRLAQLTHAPNLWWFAGASGAINSKLPTLLPSAADPRNQYRAEARFSTAECVDMELRARLDFVFLGGLQVDAYGNLNMVCIGDYHKPKLRGPGTVGLIFGPVFRRAYLYLGTHNPKTFVEKVDFISGPGYIDGKSALRAEIVPPEVKGPHMVITPLAVCDFEPESKRMRLVSVHPGHTVDEVRQSTGFHLILPHRVAETEPPGTDELRLLREVIDPQGVLRRQR